MTGVPGQVLELLATVGGRISLAPDSWLGHDGPGMVAACVMDLASEDRDAFLTAFEHTPWTLLLVAHDTHPALMEIAGWVAAQRSVLLLATPSGPMVPAVAALAAVRSPGGPDG